MLFWSRASAYRAVKRGDLPVVRDGKLMLVPRRDWDEIVRHVRQQLRLAKQRPLRPPPKTTVETAPEGATVEA